MAILNEGANNCKDAMEVKAMEMKTQDEVTIKKYLLGQTSAKEQAEFELWLMSDEDAYERIVAAEDDLIDDSLLGKLKGEELDRFNTYFLAAPERRQKLEFSRSLLRHVREAQPKPRPQTAPSPVSVPFWSAVMEFFQYRPTFSYAASALILLITAGGIFSSIRMVDLKRKVDAANQQREALQSQLTDIRSENEGLKAELQAVENSKPPASLLSPLAQVAAVYLEPGASTRSASEPPVTIETNDEIQIVPFRLALPPDDGYDRYRVALLDNARNELWTSKELASHKIGNAKELILIVPFTKLRSGDFSLSLTGVSASQTPEPITFFFRVRR